MLTPLLSDIILVILLLIGVWLIIRSHRSGDSTIALKLDHRFDEFLRRINQLEDILKRQQIELNESASKLREELRLALAEHNTSFEELQLEAIKQLTETLTSGMTNTNKQVGDSLTRSAEELGKRVDELTKKTEQRLAEISTQVEKKLTEGFEKTNATFTDILKRLVVIDEAQKKITELSSNVISLQEILADKRSRGAFGEVQLDGLVKNILPEAHFKLQYKLPNDKIADCVLFLPEPTGTLAIDAKFPLESYQRMTDINSSEADRKSASSTFKSDIQKHISDISEKYIIPGTTSDGALMFIPAEAIFAEIQSRHPDLVERAHRAKVWMVSPTTLWAILNTARSVLKDAATREQVHVIQEHLGYLAKDFERFEKRMDDLARHIKQAHDDVDNVNISAKKISSRFNRIEQVELENEKEVSLKVIEVDEKNKIS